MVEVTTLVFAMEACVYVPVVLLGAAGLLFFALSVKSARTAPVFPAVAAGFAGEAEGFAPGVPPLLLLPPAVARRFGEDGTVAPAPAACGPRTEGIAPARVIATFGNCCTCCRTAFANPF